MIEGRWVRVLSRISGRGKPTEAGEGLCKGNDFWLFILGVNNSGTTLLAKLLEAHPRIRSLPQEGQHLTDAFPRPDILGVGRLWTQRLDLFRWGQDSDPAPAAIAKKDWSAYYAQSPGLLLEKSPPNTVRSLWLQENFQPCRFISINRHPYAVCEGIRRRMNYPIEAAAQHWCDASMILIDDERKLDRCLTIRYGDLILNPVSMLQDIQKFLDLSDSFDLSILHRISSHSIEGTTSGIKNMDIMSIERLTEVDKGIIDKICKVPMSYYGYSRI